MTSSRASRLLVRLLVRLLALGGLGLGLAGCSYLPRPVRVPLRTLPQPTACAVRPETLLVMLPGAYSRPEDFIREGFVDAVRERAIAADVVLVDAHLGYYERRTVLDRVYADVIVPARAAGYRKIWLVGISIGGFGSMLVAEAHPGEIDGIVAIGPYLGERPTIDAITAQGGLREWQAPASPRVAEDDRRETLLWTWLQRYAHSPASTAAAGLAPPPPLWLAYGTEDRFGTGHRLLAAVLPPDHVVTAPGGHDWRPWVATWSRVLDRLPLPHDPGCVRPATGG